MFFLRIQCLDGWCFSLWGERVPSDFLRLSSKASHNSEFFACLVFVQTDLSVPVSKMFFVQGLQKNIEILLQEWPMLVEWTHHLSSFEVSALEGGDACFTEMLKARISIVHLGILWGVCGGGGPMPARKTQRNYSFRQVRGDAVSFPPSSAIAMKQHDKWYHIICI